MDFAYKSYVILSTFLLHNCIGQSGPISFTIEISPSAAEQMFNIGDNRVMQCSSSATEDNQRPALHWEINNVKITTTARNSRVRIEPKNDGSIMLKIDKVLDSDKGIYKCVATLGSQTDSRTIIVEIIQALSVQSPIKQWGRLGEDGILKCEAVAKPLPSITWEFENGTYIENGPKYVIQASQLLIKNLDFQDDGKYICDIVVIATGTGMTFNIEFSVVQIPRISMPPIINPSSPKVGDKVVISCTADGVPPPKYEFKKGDNLLPESDVNENTGTHTIQSAKIEDEAIYTCVARNIGGSDEKSNRLDIKIPPTIDHIPDITNAVEGGQERITCTAHGDPAPTVVWQKEGFPAYNDGVKDSGFEILPVDGTDREDAEIKTNGKIMNFLSIKPQDVGTYRCFAFNVVGNATQVIKFEVRFKPNFDTDFKETVVFGWKGHTANLTCLASANEVASIQWNEQIENRTARIENVAPFTLTTLQKWDNLYLSSSSLLVYVSDENSPVFKDYTCEATNTMGTASRTVTLRRALPPGSPTVRIFNTLSTKVTLELHAPSDNGGLPVTGYQYSYYPSDNIASKVDFNLDSTFGITPVELKDLKASTSYIFKASARNVVGLSTEASVPFQTKDVSKPAPMTFRSPAEGPEPTSYTVEWDDPDDGGSPITHYVMQYMRITVSGSEPSQWTLGAAIDKTYTVVNIENPNARSYTLTGLDRGTYYDLRLTAINKEGESDLAYKIIRTSQGASSNVGENSTSLTVSMANPILLLILACLSALW